MINYKILFWGQEKTGKTTLIKKMCDDKCTFDNEYRATAGVGFQKGRDEEDNGYLFWDFSGQERFEAMTAPFCKGAHLVVFCFDLSNNEQLDAVSEYIEMKLQVLEENNKPLPEHFLLVGTKADLKKQVTEQQKDNLIERIKTTRGVQLHYMETSVKENRGVTQLFDEIKKRAKSIEGIQKNPSVALPEKQEQTHSIPTPALILGLFAAGSGAIGVGLVIAAVATALLLPIAWPIALGVGAGVALFACGLFASEAYFRNKVDENQEPSFPATPR